MRLAEEPFVFRHGGDDLLGIVHRAGTDARVGVLIVVGGPQYRIGSHRQFLLVARALAAAGVPVMRFDYPGMGDSGGRFPGFENTDDEIRSAIDAFFARVGRHNEVIFEEVRV